MVPGSWGSKQTQRDEVTKVVNVGSEITTGGDLTIESGGDQRYQVAKLNSGNDLNVYSGGDITFEAVKDLHQESHEKSKSSAVWLSMKGKGHTDETVRQSELTAQGDLVIYAVGKIHADVRQVNKQTVTESIDAMVKADPKLAWLKELDAQGGVDWRQVQEIHTSFKYANSGLGPAAQMIIAILMTVLLGPAGAGLGGWALAGASSLATTGTVATINNNGDIGAGYKAVLSKDGLTNAAIAAITAGVAENYLGDMTMTKQVNGKTVIDLSSIEAVSHFAGQQLINNASAAAIAKAFGRDVTLAGILQSAVYNTLAAYSFDQAGNLGLKTGSPEKIALHALVGGMIAEASGSDFAVGAMAAGVNETFANQLRRMAAQMSPENRDHLMLMSSQLLGVIAAAVVAGDDANALQTGTYVAGNATQYNNLNHHDMSDFVGDMNACGSNETCQKNTWVGGKYEQISNEITDWSEAGMPYTHPVKETPRGTTSDTQGTAGNGSKGGTGGSTGNGAGEKIDEFIPPGMDRPFRPVNPEYPPNQSVVDAMEGTKIKNMVRCDGTDCSEIAIKLFEAAGGKGRVIEVRPSQAGNLNLYENGAQESGQFYHQVYTDGRYVYDPRLSSNPIPRGDWEQHIKGMNPDGVTISNKLKGLK